MFILHIAVIMGKVLAKLSRWLGNCLICVYSSFLNCEYLMSFLLSPESCRLLYPIFILHLPPFFKHFHLPVSAPFKFSLHLPLVSPNLLPYYSIYAPISPFLFSSLHLSYHLSISLPIFPPLFIMSPSPSLTSSHLSFSLSTSFCTSPFLSLSLHHIHALPISPHPSHFPFSIPCHPVPAHSIMVSRVYITNNAALQEGKKENNHHLM